MSHKIELNATIEMNEDMQLTSFEQQYFPGIHYQHEQARLCLNTTLDIPRIKRHEMNGHQ